MDKINAIINWSSVENLLLKHYTVGKSVEGTGAYPPLLLLKCFLIQHQARFPRILKNGIDSLFRQMAFNLSSKPQKYLKRRNQGRGGQCTGKPLIRDK